MYHAACKVEFQPFTRSYSQLTFSTFYKKHMVSPPFDEPPFEVQPGLIYTSGATWEHHIVCPPTPDSGAEAHQVLPVTQARPGMPVTAVLAIKTSTKPRFARILPAFIARKSFLYVCTCHFFSCKNTTVFSTVIRTWYDSRITSKYSYSCSLSKNNVRSKS